MQFDMADLDSGSEVDDGENATESLYEAMESKLSRIREFLKTESEFPGDKCVKKLLETIGVSLDNFLDDVKNRRNARTMNSTWTNWKHPPSLYINIVVKYLAGKSDNKKLRVVGVTWRTFLAAQLKDVSVIFDGKLKYPLQGRRPSPLALALQSMLANLDLHQ